MTGWPGRAGSPGRAGRPLPPGRWSVQNQLVLPLAAVLTLTIGATAIVSSIAVRHVARERVRESLENAAARLRDAAGVLPALEVTPEQVAGISGDPATNIVVLGSAGEVVLAVGASDAEARLLLDHAADLAEPAPVTGSEDLVAVGIAVPDDRGLRLRLADDTVPVDTVVIARDTEETAALVRQVRRISLVVAALALAVVVASAVVVVRRGLRPLHRMSESAGRVAAGDRATRLPTDGLSADLARLAATVNAAFDAQRDAEARVRAFVADASHELRSPLTTAAGWVELDLQGGLRDPQRHDRAMERVGAQLSRMRLLIEELSLLARLDEHRPLDRGPVDLTEIAREVVQDMEVAAPGRAIGLTAAPGVVVDGDRARLGQVLRNLVGNAVQHTTGPVEVEVEAVPASGPDGAAVARLRVTDHGPGMTAGERAQAFERFWRADSSRTRATGGSGLGLPIVRSIVAAHGGSVGLDGSPVRGTVATVTLPTTRATVTPPTTEATGRATTGATGRRPR